MPSEKHGSVLMGEMKQGEGVGQVAKIVRHKNRSLKVGTFDCGGDTEEGPHRGER